MSGHLPKVRIEVAEGRNIFTRVFLDEVELRGLVRVRFDTGEKIGDQTVVTLDLYAEIALEGGTEVEGILRSIRKPNPNEGTALPPADPALIGTASCP